MNNPYLDAFRGLDDSDNKLRLQLTRKYAWAIPDTHALQTIVRYAPYGVVEVGAGTGYWAYMLSQVNVQTLAFDIAPHENHWCSGNWYPVKKAPISIVKLHPALALMLCWPPYDEPMALRALQQYTGHTVIYIGESVGGCNATQEFFDLLDQTFTLQETVRIPQWKYIHDYLWVWTRTGK